MNEVNHWQTASGSHFHQEEWRMQAITNNQQV